MPFSWVRKEQSRKRGRLVGTVLQIGGDDPRDSTTVNYQKRGQEVEKTLEYNEHIQANKKFKKTNASIRHLNVPEM